MKTIRLAAISIVLLFLLTGCGSRTAIVDLAHLQNEAGDYQYENVAWDSDKEDVEELLGITLDQLLNNTDQLKQYATSESAYSWNGIPATVVCEFDGEGHCVLVSFRFRATSDKVGNFWDDIIETLLSQYGNTDPTVNDAYFDQTQAMLHSETYLWENSGTIHTALSINKAGFDNKTPSVTLSVYVIPADRGD